MQGPGFKIGVLALPSGASSAYTPGERATITLRCRASMAHISQSKPDSGLGFQEKNREAFHDVGEGLRPAA